MIYKDHNGEAIQGASPEELIMNLKNGSRFGSEQELQEYMDEMAGRVKEYRGLSAAPRTDSCENFMNDLEACGYWRRVL